MAGGRSLSITVALKSNSYWEVSYIEPDAGIGAYAVGDLYVRKTAHYSNLFHKGLPF